MGRWAQRSHRGGGPQTAAETSIVSGTIFDAGTIDVTYTATVNAGDFVETDFQTTPSDLNPTTINNLAATILRLGFADVVSGETHIDYFGSVPGVKTPDGTDL